MDQNSIFRQIDMRAVLIRMLIGGLIGLAIICFFVFGVDKPDPSWPTNWRLRPLITTPIVAAFGGIAFYLVPFVKPQNTAIRIMLYIFSGFAFLVALWMGIILGLDGTMWN